MNSTKINPTEEYVECPLCNSNKFEAWGYENGYYCVRCLKCGLLYVNPRPRQDLIEKSVQLGVHHDKNLNLNVVGHRKDSKVSTFQKVLQIQFCDLKTRTKPVKWLDIGAGFGEFIEALAPWVPPGSVCEGIEPMTKKVDHARSRGLEIREAFLSDVKDKYDVVSIIDVFSHVPNFGSFLQEIKVVLHKGGEIFIKTGNGADVGPRSRVPGPLTLPDHLVFAGESHIKRFLDEAGFDVVNLCTYRVDGFIYSVRNFIKWILRKPVHLGLPYTSSLRTMYIRARLRN